MSTTPRFLGDGEAVDTKIFDTTMAAHLRFVIDSNGEAAAAGVDDKALGVTWQGESADSRNSVRFNHNAGTQVMTASEAISVGAKVYAAASGKVAATGTICEGVAVSSATADGDLIEVVPNTSVDAFGAVEIERTATSDGLTTAIIPDGAREVYVEVTSASANNIVVLPAPVPGTKIHLAVGANGYELRSSAPATVAIAGGTGATAESAIPANSVAVLHCISATNWVGYTVTAATLAAVEVAA